MDKFKTGQEEFWAGEFGDDYTTRNRGVDGSHATRRCLRKYSHGWNP